MNDSEEKSKWLAPADHPIWYILKSLVFLGFLILFSYTNASNFDSTELTMIAQMAFVLFGIEASSWFANRKKSSGN